MSLQNPLERKVEGLVTPIESFIRKQAAAGMLLFVATALALFLTNSVWAVAWAEIPNIKFGVYLYRWSFVLPIKQWISDGLLALFFFLIGLEIKREILVGELRSTKYAIFVFMAAIGGMIVPGIIYYIMNYNGPGQVGWAIPMTTDTAFAIGILALITKKSSKSVAIFLAALAIIDDIITIIVISIFYTQELNLSALFESFLPLLILIIVNIMGIRRGWIYAVLGIVFWWYIQQSGIHATLAGLVIAMTVPARAKIGQRGFVDAIRAQILNFEESKKPGQAILEAPEQHALTVDIGETVKEASTPLQRWHSLLENPIAIIVLPLFALVHSGVYLTFNYAIGAMSSPVTLGIIAGLVIGKPLGIVIFSTLSVRLKVAQIPEGIKFTDIVGVSLLAGIGFTMSLFIAILGFNSSPELLEFAKIGILFSSALSAIFGIIWLKIYK